MSCSRCQGLMVAETLFNPSEGVTHTGVPVIRCFSCGNLEDALCIPDHLRRSTKPVPQRREVWRAGVREQGDNSIRQKMD